MLFSLKLLTVSSGGSFDPDMNAVLTKVELAIVVLTSESLWTATYQ